MAEQLRPGDPRWMGPYRLTGRLGAGGMGEVFLGRSAGGRAVAVKVIRPELAADPEFRARFRREVAAARSVSGLYTAAVADADASGPVPWLATAYVPGPSLARAVDVDGPLPVRSVLALAAGLAEGLAAIHRAGLVHRDLKPSNVLLAADGPRIIDFGIARDAHATILTVAGQVVGSPDYMSPEQASGREVGPQSDVFSLGAVLTYAASGQPPFRGAVTPALLTSIVHDEPELRLVPAELRPVITGCLAKDPDTRPTPAQLLARLGEHAGLPSGWLPEHLLDTPSAGVPAPPQSPVPPRPREEPGFQRAAEAAGMKAASADAWMSEAATQTVRTPPPPPTGAARQAPASPPAGLAPDLPPAQAAPASRRPGRGPRRLRWGTATAVLVLLAVTGLGGWLALDGHLTGGGAHSSGLSSEMPGPASAPPRPRSPYQLAVTGARELSCADPAALRSVGGGRPAEVVFTDRAATAVQVIWLTFDGRRHPEVVLRPGTSRRLRAYTGDAWELADGRGCIAAYATTAASHITVTKPG